MIHKGVIERLVSAGLSREQAEVAVVIAEGAKMSDLKKALGDRAVQQARILKNIIGPRSQIKALVESCRLLMLFEKAEEEQEEEIENGDLGESNPWKSTEERYPG